MNSLADEKLRVLSYNIHKGFSLGNWRFILNEIRTAIREIKPDVVCLQEVCGENQRFRKKVESYPLATQFEFLADEMWPHFAYGKNAVYQSGHHGNAILSRYPIDSWNNFDMSTNRYEHRGLLHAVLRRPGAPVHVLTTHLNLLENGRRVQIQKICDYLKRTVADGEKVLFTGDFNDWGESATQTLGQELGLSEAFMSFSGHHARTFPSFYPKLKLDRIYFKNLDVLDAQVLNHAHWKSLSDHLPICADFSI